MMILTISNFKIVSKKFKIISKYKIIIQLLILINFKKIPIKNKVTRNSHTQNFLNKKKKMKKI